MKKTWQLIRFAIKRKPKKNNNTQINSVFWKDTHLTDPLEIANSFNNYFATIPAKIIKDIPQLDPGTHSQDPVAEPAENSQPHEIEPNTFDLVNNPVNVLELFEAAASLEPKKTNDFNGISMMFIKKYSFTFRFRCAIWLAGRSQRGFSQANLK